MKKTFFLFLATALVTAALISGCKEKTAENWPQGVNLTCIIPWKAGGGADTMARPLLKHWEKELGTNIIVSNKEGAATLLGTELFLRQPDDGTYMYIGTQLYMSAGIVLQDAKFSMDDFAVINFQQFDPITVAVHEDSPYQTLDDLIRDIKARPGEVKCGIVYGGAPHLVAVHLKDRLGLDYREVTYDSVPRTALLGKHVDFIFSNANGDRSIKGKARVLAVADDIRNEIWPDSPTFNEALGVSDFPKLGSARFIAVRRGVKDKHPERFRKLVETYKTAFDNPEYVQARVTSGEQAVSRYTGPEEGDRLNKELHSLLERYKEPMSVKK